MGTPRPRSTQTESDVAVLLLDASDRIVDGNERSKSWFGSAGAAQDLINDELFLGALKTCRRTGKPFEHSAAAVDGRGPFHVTVEPLGSKGLVVLFRADAPDPLPGVLEAIATEVELETTLNAVVAYGQAKLSEIVCTLSLLDDTGQFRRVSAAPSGAVPVSEGATVNRTDTGFEALEQMGGELGVKVCWSWPLRDHTGRTRGMLEAFSPTPRLPSESEAKTLHVLALLASEAISTNHQRRELRDAVERFELVLGTTQHVLYDWHLPSNRLLWHARTGDAFGHWAATRDGDWWRDTIHPEDRERVERAFRAMQEGAQVDWSETYRFRRASGGWAWVHDAGRIERDEAGTAVRLVGLMQDVTEARDLRSRLAVSERLASVGTLAAGVAHEINNPLAWITSNVNFALEEFESLKRSPKHPDEFIDDMVDALEDARAGAERVSVIVRDLKTFSRPQDERVGTVDVRRVLDSAITMAANEIRHRAKLVREQNDVPPVEGNEGRLSQVFLNLILNAAQSLPENDAGRHEIRIVTGVDPQGRVAIEVRDTGCGISAEVLPRIFDPFFTTKGVGQGTGLGLSMCHSIVTSMNGTIEVLSRVGVGSTFRVLLPAKAAHVAQPAAVAAATPVVKKATIIVIDDEPNIIASIERVLASSSRVMGFTSAKDALAAISVMNQEPDVIFCDLMMPDLSGHEFFQRLVAMKPKLAAKVVFITGGAFTSSAQDFLETVKPPLVEKPFKPEELRRAVSERLQL